MAYRWGNGVFPKFSWPAGFVQEDGHCYLGQIPEEFIRAIANSGEPTGSTRMRPNCRVRVRRTTTFGGAAKGGIRSGTVGCTSLHRTIPIRCIRVVGTGLMCGSHETDLGGLVADSESGRNLTRAYREYVDGRSDVDSEPSMISFISTADCNIDCPSCSQNIVRVTKVQHRPETMPSVLAKVPYLSQFIWHGGEPISSRGFASLSMISNRRTIRTSHLGSPPTAP